MSPPSMKRPRDLPPDLRIRVEAAMRPAREAFEVCLERLAQLPAAPRVARLAELTWDIVGAEVVPTVLPVDEKMLSSMTSGVNFAILGDGESDPPDLAMVICVAPDLLERMKRDPAMQAGAVVFAGSHAIDVWSGKLSSAMSKVELHSSINGARVRASIYEAEFLHALLGAERHWRPNQWQRDTLAQWPNGWDSEGAEHYWYEPRPWDA